MLSASMIIVLFMALIFGLFCIVFFAVYLFFAIQGFLIHTKERFNARTR